MSRSRRWALAGAASAALAGLLGWQWLAADTALTESQGGGPASTAQTAAGGASRPVQGTAGGPFSAAGLAARQQQLVLWQQRYVRAEQVYTSYRDATRYPPESRLIEEHPDQVRPFEPVVEELPMREASGKPVKGLRLRTSQSQVFVAGADSAKFTIEAVDEEGRAVPLVVNRSAAQSMPDTTALIAIIQAEVPFVDDGAGPDEVAADGKYSARLVPAAQGFGSHAGTIRVLVQVTANGERGAVAFDVIYGPAAPATWAGVREALEEGSLNFYLKAQVKTSGRYVASGRVYDATGQPFALLQFNEMVPAGAAEFKLSLAGVLVHDKNPVFPLRLVDVEGFLLQPDTFPDRAMMPRQPGVVHQSKRYNTQDFSPAEWQSEERDRYLAEYGRDMQEALDQMSRLRGK
ncbi:choice-of-anchor X domain-containing protein [Caenimonas soli]|uniref:choice-of-anchor X domain-containing protein n=1 Tax=Caenimonas soli TaxID=2735555 RepID=UPI0015575F8C|nr:choice-of-anchor X domain-containing protein [Caenimonas soli]NPC55429.1 hypothetical protein [Caenimonas soli]